LTVYKLVIGYDGTDFNGFQVQPGQVRTVQSELEAALLRLYNKPVQVKGASRTDAGVHARGQAVAFSAPDVVPEQRIPLALNSLLPNDIVVYSACQVEPGFNPQHAAKGKVYTYTIDNQDFPNVLLRRYAWHLPRPLDIDSMRAAGSHLLGKNDFKSFQATGSSAKTTVRELCRLEVSYKNGLVKLTLEADGFLYRMARNIVGSLVMVGRGEKGPGWIKQVLEAKTRSAAGPTAPPQGLCLEKVFY